MNLLRLMGGPSRHVTLQRNLYLGYSLGNGAPDSPLTDLRIEANGFATLTPRNHGLAQADQIRWRANRYEIIAFPRRRQGLGDGSILNAVGGRPRSLGPVGPAWMDLQRDPAAAPLRRYWGSPWLIWPREGGIRPALLGPPSLDRLAALLRPGEVWSLFQAGSAHGLSPRSAPMRWAQAKPLKATALSPWPGKQESPTQYKPLIPVRLKGMGSRPGSRIAGMGP